jgi:hypothetical protein
MFLRVMLMTLNRLSHVSTHVLGGLRSHVAPSPPDEPSSSDAPSPLDETASDACSPRYALRDRQSIRHPDRLGFAGTILSEPTSYRDAIHHQEW